jgi:hypothetical protein
MAFDGRGVGNRRLADRCGDAAMGASAGVDGRMALDAQDDDLVAALADQSGAFDTLAAG